MTPEDLATLRALKALRERREAAALAAARAKAEAARQDAERAARMARSFGALRQARGGILARRLLAAPQGPEPLAIAQAELLDLAARAGRLVERARVAGAEAASLTRLGNRAEERHALAVRRLAAWDALGAELGAQQDAAAEREAETVNEEAAETRATRWTG